jgi:hypothetical protein
MNLSLKVEETIFFKFQPLKFTKGICATDLEASLVIHQSVKDFCARN